MSRRTLSTVDLVEGVSAGDPAILGRAITLIESTRRDHQRQAEELLLELLPRTGGALRLGISGTPGVGKSTFIEAFGTMLVERGHRVAVLAVDPSSTVSGGSILGDKTRMTELARDPAAFIRPSPSSGTLGGVAERTRETLLLCEAAGFDIVLVETVGVGQSETMVAGMVDFFIVLMLVGAGDDLQGIKRGILELADLLVVNKADGDNLARAERARRAYASALAHFTPRLAAWKPPVLTCSGLEGTGLREIWDAAQEHRALLETTGELQARRREQARGWLWAAVETGIRERMLREPALGAAIEILESDVAEGRITVGAAAERVLATLAVAEPE